MNLGEVANTDTTGVVATHVCMCVSRRRQRRSVAGGELESAARLVRVRARSRERSPSAGAVRAVSACFVFCVTLRRTVYVVASR